MKITSIHLRNFKRFTDLTVSGIPASAKVVVVVGPNGCGKSSLFDALLVWYRARVGFGINQDDAYYKKEKSESFSWSNNVQVTVANDAAPHKGCLYVRTAYRNDADFSVDNIAKPAVPSEQVTFGRLIENDATVSANYRRLLYDTMSAVYSVDNDDKSVAELRQELIGRIQKSMTAVFGDLQLNGISDPLGAGSFFFDKGSAKGYHYKNLSGGEKAAFDILLDLHVKAKFFPDAVYCIDELETHLHTRIQGALLKEMAKIIPEECQLWVTTHSLGVLRAALEMDKENAGSVAVIDFDAGDSDVSREIMPSNLGRLNWEKMLSIALDDLSSRVSPETVVVCEGSTVGGRRKDFDAEIYNRILGEIAPGVVFVSGGSSNQVSSNGVSVRHILQNILPRTKIVSLCDRDDKSNTEVAEFESNGNLVLSRRNLESYLFADDVIGALLNREGKAEMLGQALKIKEDAIEQSVARGNPGDDLKSAAGDIYVGLKRLLGLRQVGNSTDTFMRDTLAHLIVDPMSTFTDLKRDVLDRI